ncbi:MAG TPA: polysaccharide biosynthesis/export family protein [Longimicrobiaceae bacterium]|nr:polysaccharide biosynthesis/export family protein [Longimicrobiaceae bacterium]
MRRTTALLLLVLLLLPQAVALGQARGSEDATLLPGDVVRVQIWKEEDLSGDFMIDENGTITLPLLGQQRVAGMPVSRLRDTLIEQYRVQLRNPSINITPLRRLHVLGEVQKPGIYPVDLTVSLAGVVALAGGATPAGDLRRIRIVRDGQVLHNRAEAGQTLNTLDIRSGDQIFLEQRSWLSRNSSALLASGLSFFGSIVTTLIIINSTNSDEK